jgi:hypothetical protein
MAHYRLPEGAGLSQARRVARSSREVPLRPRNAGSILLYENERIPHIGWIWAFCMLVDHFWRRTSENALHPKFVELTSLLKDSPAGRARCSGPSCSACPSWPLVVKAHAFCWLPAVVGFWSSVLPARSLAPIVVLGAGCEAVVGVEHGLLACRVVGDRGPYVVRRAGLRELEGRPVDGGRASRTTTRSHSPQSGSSCSLLLPRG